MGATDYKIIKNAYAVTIYCDHEEWNHYVILNIDYKNKLETLDHYVRSILNKFDPDDEIEVDIQEVDGKKIAKVKILDRVIN